MAILAYGEIGGVPYTIRHRATWSELGSAEPGPVKIEIVFGNWSSKTPFETSVNKHVLYYTPTKY